MSHKITDHEASHVAANLLLPILDIRATLASVFSIEAFCGFNQAFNKIGMEFIEGWDAHHTGDGDELPIPEEIKGAFRVECLCGEHDE